MASEVSNAALAQQLRQLVDAQLVGPVSMEAFAFRHALTREAVYASLLKRQRLVYHELVAEALEEAGQAADLAYHYREAANWVKALDYARRAGEQAQQKYAPREAAEHFSHALEAAERLGQPLDLGLLRARAQANETVGEFERARADYELGLGQARAAGAAAAEAEWQALLDLGFLWAGRDYGRTGEYFQQALAQARAGGHPQRVAQSLNRVGNWLVNTGKMEAGLELHQEALALFQAAGSAADMADTHDLLALTYALIGDTPTSALHSEQAMQLFRQVGNKIGLISGLAAMITLAHTSDVLPWAGKPLATVERMAAEADDLARQVGWLAGEAQVQWMTSISLAHFGRLGPARAAARSALAQANEIDHRQWITAAHVALGYIHLQLLEPETAREHLRLARRLAYELGSAWWIGYGSTFLALAYLQLGRPAEAQAELRTAASAMGLEAGWPARAPRTLLERYLCWAWGEAALAQHQAAEALAVSERLIACAVNPTGEAIPPLYKLQGEALQALSRPAEAQAVFDRALEAARQHGTPPILWQIHHSRARLAEQQGQDQAAAHELEAAQALMEEMAATLPETERAGFRERAGR